MLPQRCGALQRDSFCKENYSVFAFTSHFRLEEFNCHDGTGVPKRFRGHVQELMENLEILRETLGNSPVWILSGYRTYEYNRDVVYKDKNIKKLDSKHLCGMAADLKVRGHSPGQVFAAIENLIAQGKMKQGGLGLYETFVHYDIREEKARWW